MKIGVILSLGEQEKLGRPLSYAELRAMAVQAEEAGFDSVWIYDHLLYRFPDKEPTGVWEAWTIFTGLAEATKRVELGALVMCTAFRNPGVLAKMAVTFDEVSNGRLILGLGAGWHQPEFDAFGLPFHHKVDQFEEALKIIVPLVREGTVDFTGTYSSAPNSEMLPRPKRRIPVLIASFKPRMLHLTAQYADSWNTAWLGQVGALEKRRTPMEEACKEAGRDPKTLEVTVGVNVAFPDLGEAPEGADNPDRFLTGTSDEIGAGLRGYADAGVGHVILNVNPFGTEALTLAAAALKAYHG